MNRIERKFKELRHEGKKAFIAYITAGDPNLRMTSRLVLELEKSGVDIIELGIPFSDPLADGPTIQAASQRALAGKTTLSGVFDTVAYLRRRTEVPIAFMTYYNPVLKYGVTKFFKKCGQVGVDGVIIPDLPYEEAADVKSAAKANSVATIFLASPTSTMARLNGIARNSTGFIYYVSLTGVTGARSRLPAEIRSNVMKLKSVTNKPIAVGFGVSRAVQARHIARSADAVIIGSAIVKIIGEKKNIIAKVKRFAKSISRAVHNA